MADSFIGEIRIFAFDYAPRGWAFCDGQLLPINQNQALFSLVGTFYGGNGTTNFALPNLQGRVPIHQSAFNPIGFAGGQASVTLNAAHMPVHSHSARGVATGGDTSNPANAAWAPDGNSRFALYRTDLLNQVAMAPQALAAAGGGQAHPNEQPSLVLSFAIALQGPFPSRD